MISSVSAPDDHFGPSICLLVLESTGRRSVTTSYAVETNANSLFYGFQFSSKRFAVGWRFMIIATIN